MEILHMTDFKNISDLISSTEANKSAFVDYLLEYVEGDYQCLDGSASNEILAFSSFALKFKHIYALAILLKLQEATDTSNFAKAFSDEFQINIKKESEELVNLLFYIRHSLPEDLFYKNCDKFKYGNGIIQNEWNYPYDIIDHQEKMIEYLKDELSTIENKYCEIIHEQEDLIERLRHELLIKDNELKTKQFECQEYKQKYARLMEPLVKLVAVNPGLATMLKLLTI